MNLKENGQYTYFLLKKTGLNTIDAVNKIADRLNLSSKYINFGGTKDRNAITEQYISISKGPKNDLYLDGIELKYLGEGDERINLGSLEGNEFEIIIETDQELRLIKKTINYFDDQRFGMNKNNHVVGKLLVQKKFKEACEELMINAEGNNYVGALKKLHKKILQLYVHAYQSYLWNETVKEFIKANMNYYEIDYSLGKLYVPEIINDLNQTKVPLIGFGSEVDNEKLNQIIDVILKKEGINQRDFIIKEIQGLSSQGDVRNMVVEIKNLNITDMTKKGIFEKLFPFIKSKINSQKQESKKYKLNFFLGRGSYATIVVKSLFS